VLAGQERPHGVDRVGLGWILVGAVTLHPGEAQGHPAGVAGGGLRAVEGDLDNDLRTDIYGDPASLRFQFEEPLRLPAQRLVGEALDAARL
jgi:hypothetical protein